MTYLTVDWDEHTVPLRAVDELEEGDFYAIMSGLRDGRSSWSNPRVLYIGQAYYQPVVKRIKEKHQAFAALIVAGRLRPGRELIVMTGRVGEASQRVTRALVDDAENLLIFHNKPPMNRRSKRDYLGRRPLFVQNAGGFAPLKALSTCCAVHRSWGKALKGRMPDRCAD